MGKIQRYVYTVTEVAARYRACEKTIRKWAEDGRIPKPIAPGRWSVAQIEAHLRGEIFELLEKRLELGVDSACNSAGDA